MSNELITSHKEMALSKVILEGDLSKLKPEEKVIYYKQVCDSVGLNPLTQPFNFIRFQGKEVLYAGKNCTEQLREINGISIRIVATEKIDGLYIVTAEATNRHGRCDSSTGAVNLKGLSGDALANAVMKAETKAKRRVTLSISGLGYLDESETDSVPGAQKLNFDMETGEIKADVVQQEYIPANDKRQPPKQAEPAKPKETPVLSEEMGNLLMKVVDFYNNNQPLDAVEFWVDLVPEVKAQLRPCMGREVKDWYKSILASAPKLDDDKKPSAVDYASV